MAHNGCGALGFVAFWVWLVLQVGQIVDALLDLSRSGQVLADEFVKCIGEHQHGGLVVLPNLSQIR